MDCFLDFEEPLDDFLGFFIRWYFRASSLSGAAASQDGDGRFPEVATVVDVGSGLRISSLALLGEGMSPKTSMVSAGREEPWEPEKPVVSEVKAVAGR